MPYNQQAADERHRKRRDRLKQLRDELSTILNDYWERFPETPAGESELEYRIAERLRFIEREIDTFIRVFKDLPNE